MTSRTQPRRNEHQELLPRIERLRTVADAIGAVPAPALRRGVDEVYDFLADHLIPQAEAAERVLYPAVSQLLGTEEASSTMRCDQVELCRLTEELAALRARWSIAPITATELTTLRRILYGLYTLVKVHVVKEEEVYLPLLDARLTAAEAANLFTRMEQAAAAAKGAPARLPFLSAPLPAHSVYLGPPRDTPDEPGRPQLGPVPAGRDPMGAAGPVGSRIAGGGQNQKEVAACQLARRR